MNQQNNSEDILVICSGSMVFWVDPVSLEPRQCEYYEPGWRELKAKKPCLTANGADNEMKSAGQVIHVNERKI